MSVRKSNLLLAIAMLVASSSALHAEKVLRVTTADNESTEFVLAHNPTLSYVSEGLQIVAGSMRVVYPVNGEYTCEIAEASAIDKVHNSHDIKITILPEAAILSGLSAADNAIAVDINGRVIASAQADSNGTATLHLGATTGVIIVKAANTSFKILSK